MFIQSFNYQTWILRLSAYVDIKFLKITIPDVPVVSTEEL